MWISKTEYNALIKEMRRLSGECEQQRIAITTLKYEMTNGCNEGCHCYTCKHSALKIYNGKETIICKLAAPSKCRKFEEATP